MLVLDFVGNEITAGCTVCYPVRRGSNLWMNRMVVTQVAADQITGQNPHNRRLTHVKNLQNVVVVVPPEKKSA